MQAGQATAVCTNAAVVKKMLSEAYSDAQVVIEVATGEEYAVAVNKDNVTSGVIASAKAFALTVIDQTADMLYIGNFGFRTSSDYDKFAKYETRETALGMPYVPEYAAALFSCRLIDTVDVGTHLLFIGEVEDAERLSDETPLTYDYYHKVLKGKTPPKASSYQG